MPYTIRGELSGREITITEEEARILGVIRTDLALTGSSVFEFEVHDVATRWQIVIGETKRGAQLLYGIGVEGHGCQFVPQERPHAGYLKGRLTDCMVTAEVMAWLIWQLSPESARSIPREGEAWLIWQLSPESARSIPREGDLTL